MFPQNTPEEIRLFNLINAAYAYRRYDPDFVAAKKDIESLITKVEILGKVISNEADLYRKSKYLFL